jgi:hypothetical protein
MGPVGGVNEYTGASQTTLRGNYDTNGTFYFAYDDSLTQHNGVYIAKGAWSNGTVTNITPLRGITSSTNITFDVYISPAGNTLVSDFVVLSWFHRPASSTIFGASKNPDGSFTPWANSGAILATLNSIPGRPLVYNPSLTPDGLTVFVTAAPSQPGFRVPVTYAATRASGLEPFGTPVLVDAINNPGDACAGKFSEMGGVSPDGKHLYFHRWTGKTTDLLCVLTRQ